MVEGQHGMSLATTERGFELHDGVCVTTGETLERVREETLHPVGQIGAMEELDWVAVLGAPLAFHHLRQVSCELGVTEPSGGHVGMGLDYVSPGLECHYYSLGGLSSSKTSVTRAG